MVWGSNHSRDPWISYGRMGDQRNLTIQTALGSWLQVVASRGPRKERRQFWPPGALLPSLRAPHAERVPSSGGQTSRAPTPVVSHMSLRDFSPDTEDPLLLDVFARCIENRSALGMSVCCGFLSNCLSVERIGGKKAWEHPYALVATADCQFACWLEGQKLSYFS